MHLERTRANWVGFSTIVVKEIRRILRIWVQTVVPPVIQMTLYFLIFGSVIGSRVGKMNGYDYMTYIAPGLIMMSVITNSYTNVVSSFFGAKFSRYVEELMISPLANASILLGYMAGGMFRGLLVGAIVTLVAALFTNLPIAHPWVIVTTALLTSAMFSVGGFLNALFAKKFDDVTIIPTFVLTPLVYLGGVFYSIALLPPIWQHVTRVDPLLYMIDTLRYGFLGVSDIALTEAYAIMVGFLVLLFALALWLLRRGTGLKS
ncbi:MAG: ABC transporter permease [Gammaproteobacteria bacterium]|nr:ABC transporter permease [Gammaproteobacteria bacterium]